MLFSSIHRINSLCKRKAYKATCPSLWEFKYSSALFQALCFCAVPGTINVNYNVLVVVVHNFKNHHVNDQSPAVVSHCVWRTAVCFPSSLWTRMPWPHSSFSTSHHRQIVGQGVSVGTGSGLGKPEKLALDNRNFWRN